MYGAGIPASPLGRYGGIKDVSQSGFLDTLNLKTHWASGRKGVLRLHRCSAGFSRPQTSPGV